MPSASRSLRTTGGYGPNSKRNSCSPGSSRIACPRVHSSTGLPSAVTLTVVSGSPSTRTSKTTDGIRWSKSLSHRAQSLMMRPGQAGAVHDRASSRAWTSFASFCATWACRCDSIHCSLAGTGSVPAAAAADSGGGLSGSALATAPDVNSARHGLRTAPRRNLDAILVVGE